jgi:lipopolysaccharide biosynthesis glycosyltransferase
MNIVITVDDNYIRPALVMLESLFEHNNPDIHIYLLHSNVCDENLKRLAADIGRLGGRFSDIRVPAELFEGAAVTKYFTKEMYYRLLIPQLLPDEERALYLDPDIIIFRSIEEFYRSDFDGSLMIAVPDYLGDVYYPERKKNLGLESRYKYINSGVILFNIAPMNECFSIDDMFRFMDECGLTLEFPDQDLINVYFKDRIKYAPREYNFTTEYVSTGDFLRYVFSPRYRRSERERAVIAHYMGKCKPWKPSYYYKFYRIYRSYLNKYLTAREKRELLLRPWLVFKSVAAAVWRVISG